jgi:hypothetical protein
MMPDLLSDKDEFLDRTLESRMASRAYMVVAHFRSGRWDFVSRYLKNTAWRIDRDLVAIGVLPLECAAK